jgi:hypothetical protein
MLAIIRPLSILVADLVGALTARRPVRVAPLPLPRDIVQTVAVIPNVLYNAPHQRFNPVVLAATVGRHTPLSGRHNVRHARVRNLF